MKIQITDDVHYLTLVGGADYAKEHAGKIYTLENIDSKGWAYPKETRFKFPPDAFKKIEEIL